MPVELPPAPRVRGIALPVPPQTQATLEDISNGVEYLTTLKHNRDFAIEPDQRVSKDDVANGHAYLFRVLASNTAAPLVADVVRHVLRDELTPIKRQLSSIHRLAIQTRNMTFQTGLEDFTIIPFINSEGDEEHPEDYGLPLLTNTRRVHELTDVELNTYMDKYGVPRAGNPPRHLKEMKLKDFIGCT